MANYNISTEVSKKGAEGSKRVQQANAEARWEAADLKCLNCSKPIARVAGLQVAIQMKRKYCDARCVQNHRWAKWHLATGTEKTIHGPAVATVPFKTKGEVTRQMIRHHSKKVYFSRYPGSVCEICGYAETKVDVAHVLPISKFTESALLLEINQLSNLAGLCKNCHNEFDTGKIPLSRVEKVIAARAGKP